MKLTQQKKRLKIIEKKLKFMRLFDVNNLPWGYTVRQFKEELSSIKKDFVNISNINLIN